MRVGICPYREIVLSSEVITRKVNVWDLKVCVFFKMGVLLYCDIHRSGTGDSPTRPSEPSHVTVDQPTAVAGTLTMSSGSCPLAETK